MTLLAGVMCVILGSESLAQYTMFEKATIFWQLFMGVLVLEIFLAHDYIAFTTINLIFVIITNASKALPPLNIDGPVHPWCL